MRNVVIVCLALAVGIALVPSACSQAPADPSPTPAGQTTGAPPAPTAKSVAGPVGVETVSAMTILCLPMSGSYEQHATAIPRLMGYAGPKGVVRGAPFGMYYNDPSQVAADSLRWAVCVPVTPETTVEPPFEVSPLREMTAAVSVCTGPYESAPDCYKTVMDWLCANGYIINGPVQEHWLTDPQSTPPDKMQARIVIPVALVLQDE